MYLLTGFRRRLRPTDLYQHICICIICKSFDNHDHVFVSACVFTQNNAMVLLTYFIGVGEKKSIHVSIAMLCFTIVKIDFVLVKKCKCIILVLFIKSYHFSPSLNVAVTSWFKYIAVK